MSRYYHTWGPWLAGLYLAAVPVQVLSVLSVCRCETIPHPPQVLSILLPLCLIKTGGGDLEGRRKEGGRKPEPDYVPATNIGHNLDFYITEMPAEKLAKIKVIAFSNYVF